MVNKACRNDETENYELSCNFTVCIARHQDASKNNNENENFGKSFYKQQSYEEEKPLQVAQYSLFL